MMEAFEAKFKYITDVTKWLEDKGFSLDVVESFEEHDMDGEAISAAFASSPGPDCLRDVVPKLGHRLKVYAALKSVFEECQSRKDGKVVSDSQTISVSPPGSVATSSASFMSVSKKASLKGSSTASTGAYSLPMKLKEEKLPEPFPIPLFRKSTEDNLAKKLLLDGDRKYIVQTLATVLMTHRQKPSLNDCGVVAKSLVKKFSFLYDFEGDGEHSMKWFIYNRTQNINKKSTKDASGASGPPRKRIKVERNDQHYYPLEIPKTADDEESNERNKRLLKDELTKVKPNSETLRELMIRTYPMWRRYIMDVAEPPTVTEILSDYPLLKKGTYVSQELSRIIGRPAIRDDFDSAFLSWAKAIIGYSKETQVRGTAIQMVVHEYSEGCSPDQTALIALRCLGLLFIATKTKRADGDIPYLMNFVPRGTPPDEAVDKQNSQPHIVLFERDDDDDDIQGQYFISIELQLMMESSNLVTAVFNLLAAHYVLNLAYHPKAKDMLTFLQEKILGIPSSDEKTKNKQRLNPLSSCHVSGIVRYMNGHGEDNNMEL